MARAFCLLALLGLCEAFSPPTKTFATFGNDASKALIRSWTPVATPVDTGVVLIPDVGNMQRYVRARILLEDANVGCIASFDDDSLCVVRPLPPSAATSLAPPNPRTPALDPPRRAQPSRPQILCRFSRSEHQLILPLWRGGQDPSRTFSNIRQWHAECFPDGARLSGKALEWADDRTAWNNAAA